MSKNYKRKHRVPSMEEVDKRLDTIANNKKSKRTTKETWMLILGILFLIITSPYIMFLLVLTWITIDYDTDWLDKSIMNYINFMDKFE